MANLNRDYLVTLDVKTSVVTLSTPLTFYVTDKRTMNIFVKLVTNESNNPLIREYSSLENATGYTLEMVLISPNKQPYYLEANLLDGDEALFCFNLDAEQISKIGTWLCELRVHSFVDGVEEVVTSRSFLYSVNQSITTNLDDVALDNTTYNIIDGLLTRIEALEDNIPGGENDNRLTLLEATKYDDVVITNSDTGVVLTFYAQGTTMKQVEIPSDRTLTDRVDDLEVSVGSLNSEMKETNNAQNIRLAECETKLEEHEENIAWLLENGGGGGGSGVGTYLSTTTSENVVISEGNNFEVSLDFYSSIPGNGTLKVSSNDKDIFSTSIPQGESTVTIPGKSLAVGENIVKMYAIDRVGAMTNTLQFKVRYGTTTFTSTFDQYQIYDYGVAVRYYFTPTALDTSDELLFYMKIDDVVQSPVTCSSDERAFFTFPNTLSIGSHYCEAWIEDSYGKSNIMKFNIVILDDSSIAVNSLTRSATVEEGAQLRLDFRAYMKGSSRFITKTYVNNVLVNTGECNAETNYYTSSSLREGQYIIKVEVWDLSQTVSDYVTWNVTITASTYEPKVPIVTGATAIFTARDRSNSDGDKEVWTGQDQDGNRMTANLTNFAFNNDSGWVNDELLITGDSYVEIPVAPLVNNARYGFTLDVEFTSKQIGVEDAEVLSLWNDTDNCGIKITTEKLILQSKAGKACSLYFSDNENVSAMFIIDRDEKTAKIYLNGVMCEAFSLSDYVSNGQAYLEDFTVNSNIMLGKPGKNGYCKIRHLRVYEVALGTKEILNNWLSNITDKEEQRAMEKFQEGNDLPTLTVYCDFAGLGKDDKKPCDIVYTSTDPNKYGESFSLMGKTCQLQYQGTSSMQYPIKNYRLNLRDSKGSKWYYNPYQGGKGECRFTLKADFMSSGHWQNTGLAKFVSDKLYGYKTNDLSTMNPAKRHDIQNGGTLKDTRDSINGFPCRLILVNDGETPLNAGQEEPTPGNTKDMGIFNFNNDKDNVGSLGLDTDIFPNCLSYEVTANSDTSAGAFVPYDKAITVDYYQYTAGICCINIPFDQSIEHTLNCYDINGNEITANIRGDYQNSSNVWIGMLNTQPYSHEYGCYKFSCSNQSAVYFRLYLTFNNTYDIERFVLDGVEYKKGDYLEVDNGEVCEIKTSEQLKQAELEYLQNSFELRYPDADDVGEDYGYLGMSKTLEVFEVPKYEQGTCLLNIDYFGTNTFNIQGAKFSELRYVDANYDFKPSVSPINNGTTVVAPNDAKWIGFSIIGGENGFYINDKFYMYGVEVELPANNGTPQSLGQQTILDNSLGLKRVIDWVGTCTDEEFKADYEKYFNKHYLLRYYLLVITLGMVDNLGKNMMLDTWDGQIWYPRFYDMDTICSYDNSGAIKFDVDIEMEQGYWNTSSSRLWTKVRDLLHDELIETYKDMRASGLSYEGLMNYFYGEQIAKIPQKYYNMDADVKYLPYADEYLGKAHGNGYEHLKRWLKNRLIFTDTLFDYGPSYESDMLTIRANTLDPITFEIETYTPVYQHVSYYNGQMTKLKIDGKTATTFTGNAQTATDQEILIYGGSNIKRIRGISSANPDSMLIGSATRLSELDISNCPILTDVNSNKANFSAHGYLNKLNIENCPNLGGVLNLSGCSLLQEVKAKGTGVTSTQFASNVKNLVTIELPASIKELTLTDARSLNTLKFEDGADLQVISLTDCGKIPNTENFDIAKVPTLTLDNSYDKEELYFSENTNLTLKNMSTIERVIYTPNSEYEEFNIDNVTNADNYTVVTSNCPKLKTFMTTAPHRESYNGDDVEYEQTVENVTRELLDKHYTIGGFWNDIGEYDGSNSFIHYKAILPTAGMEVSFKTLPLEELNSVRVTYFYNGGFINRYLYGTEYQNAEGIIEVTLTPPPLTTEIIFVCDSPYMESCFYTEEDVPIIHKTYGDIIPNATFTANTLDLSATQFEDVKLLCTTDIYNLKVPTTMKNFYCDSAMDIDTDVIEDASYEMIHEELIEPYTTNYEGEVVRLQSTTINTTLVQTDYMQVVPSSKVRVDFIDGSKLVVHIHEYDESKTKINVTSSQAYPIEVTLGNTTKYIIIDSRNVSTTTTLQQPYTPNIIPSSANGSLIFNMYSNNTTQPTSTSPYMWDLTGLKLEDFYTYGMNNQIVEQEAYREINPGLLSICTNFAPTGVNGLEYYGYHKVISKIKLNYLQNVTVTSDTGTNLRIAHNNGRVVDVTSTYLENVDKLFIAYNYNNNNPNYITINAEEGVYRIYPNRIQNVITNDEIKNSALLLELTPNTYTKVYDGTGDITMPQRMPGYSVKVINADITPINHPVMFYPKLTSETNAFEGKIDYSKYEKLDLTWAFGYLGGDNVTVIQPVDKVLQNYRGYKVYYGLNPLIENPYVITVFKSTNNTTKPSYRLSDRYDKYTTTIEMDGECFITTIRTPGLEYLPTKFAFDASPGLIAVYSANTSECTDLAYLFRDCANLEYVNFASFDTSKVTLMRAMFARSYKMKVIDLRTWDMRALKDMANAFYECSETTHIYFPSMTGGQQELNMQAVFFHCEKLVLVDMTGFDASHVIDWEDMFLLAYQLTHFYPMDNISLALDLRHSLNLTAESVSAVVENLVPVTTSQNLALASSVANRLSDEQKASVTAKGWTLYIV